MQGESAQVSESRQKDEIYFDCTKCNAYFKMLKMLFILYHLNLTEQVILANSVVFDFFIPLPFNKHEHRNLEN